MNYLVGKTLKKGQYFVEKELGVGGCGITYKALDLIEKKEVAIKTLKTGIDRTLGYEKLKKKFLDEAKRMRDIKHINIVQYQSFFEENKIPFIVMDYIPGMSLERIVLANNRLSENLALKYIQQVGEGLKIVHQHGLLHRDIKPENLIVHEKSKEVVIIDFGIAREFSKQGVTLSHTSFISQGYAPLEQYLPKAKRTPATDVYGLAATLYTLLTGEIPVASILRNRVPLPSPKDLEPKINEQLSEAVMRGMAIDASERPATVEAWLNLIVKKKKVNIQVYRKLNQIDVPIKSRNNYINSIRLLTRLKNKVLIEVNKIIGQKNSLFFPKKLLLVVNVLLGVSLLGLLINMFWNEMKPIIFENNSISRDSSRDSLKTKYWQESGTADLNLDGKSDILWRNQKNGDNKIWLMNGSKIKRKVAIKGLKNLNWQIMGTVDLNGDGNKDIFWRNQKNGENKIWLMKKTEKVKEVTLEAIEELDWKMVGAGDFNRDGNQDILWRNQKNGENKIWLMTKTKRIESLPIIPLKDTNWKMIGIGDFNGDSNLDIFWYNSTIGKNAIWLMNLTNYSKSVAMTFSKDLESHLIADNTIWEMIEIGDFNGDRKIDTLWYNNTLKQNKILFINNQKLTKGEWITAQYSSQEESIINLLLIVCIGLIILFVILNL